LSLSSAPARLAVGFGPKEKSPTPAVPAIRPRTLASNIGSPALRRYPEVRRSSLVLHYPADILS